MKQPETINVDLIKKQLVDELRDLLREKNCNLDALHVTEEFLPDLVDKATNLTDRSLSQTICDRYNLRIRKIEQALESIESGDYGICERCGDDIAVKRLKVNPVARLCIECKTKLESEERFAGV